MQFTYAARDAAGQYDPSPATVTIPFTETPQLTLTKSVVGTPVNRGNGVFRVTYQIVVQNAGDVELLKVQVTDRLDQTFVGAADFTVVSKSATLPLHINAGFTGKSPDYDLLTGTDTLPVGGSGSGTITIVVDVTPGSKVGPYTNLADSVAETPTAVPVRSSSNPVTVNFEVLSIIGVAKQVVEPVVNNKDGTYDVTYEFTVVNLGDTTLSNVQVYDNLDTTFGAGNYTVQSKTAVGLTVNPTYTGAPPANLLTGTDTLAAGATRTITLVVRVTPGSNLGPYVNQARATASGPGGALPADSLSNNGTNPDTDGDRNPNEPIDDVPTPVTFPAQHPLIGAAKAVQSKTNNGDGTFTVVYEITVKNYGDIMLNNVQVTDNLATTFAAATSFSVVSVTSAGFTVNWPVPPGTYTGNLPAPGINLLTATGNTLAFGATKTILVTVKVTPATSPATYNNQVTASGVSPAGTQVSDVSTVGTDPDDDDGNPANDNDGNPGNNNDPTPVTLTQTPGIAIVKTGPATSYVGATAVYNYAVSNAGDVRLGTVTVSDNKCSPVKAVPATGPNQGDTNTDGYLDLTETWLFTCSYVVQANDPDPLVNIATARGIGPLGQQVQAEGRWSTDLQSFNIGDFVWWDVNGNGLQDANEPGIPDVTVDLYAGACPASPTAGSPVQTDITDSSGLYGFVGVAAGSYCVVINAAEFGPTGTLKDWTASPPNVDDPLKDAIDSDGDPVTHAATAVVAAGTVNDTVDFGFTIVSSYKVTKRLTSVNPSRLGEPVTFEITIENLGDTWISTLPMEDNYNDAYLTYGFGGDFAVPDTSYPSGLVDHVNDGVLNWPDLTAAAPYGFGTDIAPGAIKVVHINFTARSDTSALTATNGEVINTVIVNGVAFDPDGPTLGPNNDHPLPPAVPPQTAQTSFDGVAIYTPTGVTFESFDAAVDGGGVVVNWRSATESEILGYNVQRQVDGGAGFVTVNPELILAENAGQDRGAAYAFRDTGLGTGAYTYRLEVIRLDGTSENYGAVGVRVRP